ALLRGADAVADRATGRHLADARVAPDPPLAREDPRDDRRGRGRGEQSRARLLPLRLDDPELVRRGYAGAARLEGRSSIRARRAGPDPIEAAFEAVREAVPVRVLEVGGG